MKYFLSKEHYCYRIHTLLIKSSPPPFYRHPLPIWIPPSLFQAWNFLNSTEFFECLIESLVHVCRVPFKIDTTKQIFFLQNFCKTFCRANFSNAEFHIRCYVVTETFGSKFNSTICIAFSLNVSKTFSITSHENKDSSPFIIKSIFDRK